MPDRSVTTSAAPPPRLSRAERYRMDAATLRQLAANATSEAARAAYVRHAEQVEKLARAADHLDDPHR